MYIESDVFATVFPNNIENTEKRINMNLSVAVEVGKDPESGNSVYEYDSWSASFVGGCFDKAKELKAKDKIVLRKFRIRNRYVPEKEKNYTSLTVFDFDVRG